MLKSVAAIGAGVVGIIAITVAPASAATPYVATSNEVLLCTNRIDGIFSESPKVDDCVKIAQSAFRQLGYGAIPTDGVFGPKTQKANRKFETAHGMAHDGKFGPPTFRVLAEDLRKQQRIRD